MSDDADLSVDTVMARRFELDGLITEMGQRHAAELKDLKEELGLCETYIKDFMLKSGAQNFKTAAGDMAFFVDKDTVTVKDMSAVISTILQGAPAPDGIEPDRWGAILGHIQQTGLWMLLKKDVNKTAVKEVINVTKQPVLGVEFSSFRGLNWRRGKSDKADNAAAASGGGS